MNLNLTFFFFLFFEGFIFHWALGILCRESFKRYPIMPCMSRERLNVVIFILPMPIHTPVSFTNVQLSVILCLNNNNKNNKNKEGDEILTTQAKILLGHMCSDIAFRFLNATAALVIAVIIVLLLISFSSCDNYSYPYL
jgi:hypothetical protein